MNIVRGLIAQPLFAARDNGDGFPDYLRAAERAGVDVNDWIEAHLGWVPALPVLQELVFPLLTENSAVCEVGVGTGRWSRHIVERIPHGKMLLVDRSPWVTEFLRGYFSGRSNVRSVTGNGVSIAGADASWADLVFSQGLFITLKLGHILTYLRSCSRTLKYGGAAVFDFVDAETPGGWEFLLRESSRAHDVFTYHSLSVVMKCCEEAGLHVEKVKAVGKSTYLIARKCDALAS
jgi:ubiquinone/menaquinone biosynthesis C-methylase UbiE